MLYFIQVTLYTGLMLLLYLLLLRDKPMHRFNRGYLLLSVVLPLVLPLLKLPLALRPQPAADSLFTSVLPGITVLANGQQQQVAAVPQWVIMLVAVYALVAVVLLTLTLVSYLKMRRIIKRSEKIAADKYSLLKHTGYGPGSWGGYIFLPDGDVNDTVIKHEQAHIQLHHSWDMVFLSIAQALLWPNLFIHVIKKELVQVHEFQADAAVAVKADEYSMLLLSSVFNTCNLPLTHSFIIHPIKRRIMMLHKNKTSGKLRSILATSLAVAALAGIVTMQSCEQKQDLKSIAKGADTTWWGPEVSYKNDSIRKTVHKMPEFKGEMYEFIAENLEYPKVAKDAGIEGKVVVAFVVDKEGNIAQKQILKSPHDSLSMAVINMLYKMPDWEPGEDEKGNKVAVFMTLPISFWLDNDDADKSSEENEGRIREWNSFGDITEEPKKTSSATDAMEVQWRWKYNDYQLGTEFRSKNSGEGC